MSRVIGFESVLRGRIVLTNWLNSGLNIAGIAQILSKCKLRIEYKRSSCYMQSNRENKQSNSAKYLQKAKLCINYTGRWIFFFRNLSPTR